MRIFADLWEVVLSRPALYLGSTGDHGRMQYTKAALVETILQIDDGLCTEVEVVLFADGTLRISDDGPPLAESMDDLMRIESAINESKMFKVRSSTSGRASQLYAFYNDFNIPPPPSDFIHLSVRGVGQRTVYHGGEIPRISPSRRYPNSMTARPDSALFSEMSRDFPTALREWLRTLAVWFPNATFRYRYGAKGKTHVYTYPGGIRDYFNERVREEQRRGGWQEEIEPAKVHLTRRLNGVTVELVTGGDYYTDVYEVITNGRRDRCLPTGFDHNYRAICSYLPVSESTSDLIRMEAGKGLWAEQGAHTRGLRAGLESIYYEGTGLQWAEDRPPLHTSFLMRLDMDELPRWSGADAGRGPLNGELYAMVKNLIMEEYAVAWHQRPRPMEPFWTSRAPVLLSTSIDGGPGWRSCQFVQRLGNEFGRGSAAFNGEMLSLQIRFLHQPQEHLDPPDYSAAHEGIASMSRSALPFVGTENGEAEEELFDAISEAYITLAKRCSPEGRWISARRLAHYLKKARKGLFSSGATEQ